MALVLSLPVLLTDRFQSATGVDPELRPATKPQFGHFQSNVALRLAKREGKPPRDIATGSPPELESPTCVNRRDRRAGLLNIRLQIRVLAEAVTDQLADPPPGSSRAASPKVVVIDYSAPNVAKQMHVGHLRTTIIGDCLNRVLSAIGHTVIPQNHIGDWGTQFGMLVEQILIEGSTRPASTCRRPTQPYLRANAHFAADPSSRRAPGAGWSRCRRATSRPGGSGSS